MLEHPETLALVILTDEPARKHRIGGLDGRDWDCKVHHITKPVTFALAGLLLHPESEF
jgi:hypothetical protein